MADITMCQGRGCDKKEQCHRHTAKESPRQSYFTALDLEVAKHVPKKECDAFWDNKGME